MTQKIKNFKNLLITNRNNFRLFLQLIIFALFAMLSLFSGQTLAQNTCNPNTTVTEGDLFPGGTVSFGVTSGLGTVTIDHVDAGTGLQSLTLVGIPVNATVNMPVFTAGTFASVAVTFTVPDPNTPVDFTLRAASTFHAINIRVRCVAGDPTPTPTPTPLGCTYTQGYWKNHADVWAGQSVMLGTVNYNQTQLLSIFNKPVQGNGLISLSRQLIAAKLNIANGASVPMNVATAIVAADMLIGNRIVPPIGSDSLPTNQTSALASILDQYNNGNTPGGPPHCDD